MTDSPRPLDVALAGRYRVEREIGAGGMATVFLALDEKHHRQVAIKVLRGELAANLGAERFLREVEVVASLHHPHILPLYDSGGNDGVLWYVMPFVDGQSLRDRLVKGGALPIDEAVRIIREVADALKYSHEHGVVHRDIKPENILLTSGHALVTDFGIAKAVSDAATASHLTGTGISLGTPSYMAPEQAMADPNVDHRADLYALGVVAYELLTGFPPFRGSSAQQIIAAHLTKTPEPLSTHRPSVPPALDAVVMRALEKSPADRWQSAGEMIRALDTSITPAGMTGAATAVSVRPSRKWRRLAIAGVVVVLLVAASLAYFAREGRAGTLIGDAVLAHNDQVIVSEFENRTADSSLAATVTDAIRMDLQDSRSVQVMSQAAMWAGLKRMSIEHGAFVPEAKVQELAVREGAKAFVVGSIARVGAGYQITARVVATNGGSEALTAHASASDSTRIITAVQDVGRTLRRGIGESLKSLMSAPALAQVSTASLPALRAYSAWRRAESEGDRQHAVALAKEAIALDTTFAAAWAALQVTYSNMALVRLSTDAINHAYALREHLSETQRLRIDAEYHETRGELVEEEAAWQRLAEMGVGEVSYANFLLGQGRLRDAEAMGRRAVKNEPKGPISYWNLAEAQVGLHEFAAADSTAAEAAKAIPNNPYRHFIPWAIAWGRRDLDTLEMLLDSPAAASVPNRDVQRCVLRFRRGELRGSQQCALPLSAALNLALALAEFRMTGDSARARTVTEKFLGASRDARDPDLYPGVIALLADLGRVKEGHQLLDEWRSRVGASDLGFRADSAQAVGAIAAAEHQWDRAVAAFLAWNSAPVGSSMHLYNRGFPEAAAILARQGKSDSAIALFERALATSSAFGGPMYEASWYTQALERLGDLYEAKGDRGKAAEYWRKYLATFKNPDPPIAVQVAGVRAKLARISAGQ